MALAALEPDMRTTDTPEQFQPLGKAIPAPATPSPAPAIDRWSNGAMDESGMPMLVGFAPGFIPPAGMNDEYTGRGMGRKDDQD